jgi:hypothetical protein
VLLDILDDVFLLNLPLEPAEGALNGFALLNLYFSHANTPPSRVATKTIQPNVLGYHGKRGF